MMLSRDDDDDDDDDADDDDDGTPRLLAVCLSISRCRLLFLVVLVFHK